MNRRAFFGASAFAAAAAGAAAVPGLTRASASTTSGHSSAGTFDAAAYGTTGDGRADDAPAINRALGAARTAGGGIVTLPAGTFRIGAALVMPDGVILQGVGWAVAYDDRSVGKPGSGTWLSVGDPSFIPIQATGNSAGLRDLAVVHVQPDPMTSIFTPTDYPFTIDFTGNDFFVDNVMLLNPTRGISAHGPNGSWVQRLHVRHLYGQPLKIGMQIDNMGDVMKVHDVHFWPYWYDGTSGSGGTVTRYMMDNAVAFRSLRNDNPQFSDIFIFGYGTGFSFESSGDSDPNGITNFFKLSNLDFDACGRPFVFAASTTGQMANVTMGSESPFPKESPTYGDAGVHVLPGADGSRIQIANLISSMVTNQAVLVESGNVSVTNLWVEYWNQSNTGAPAVEASPGASLYVAPGAWFEYGNGAPTGV